MEYSLVFSDTDLDILSTALVNMPYKDVAPLIKKLNIQLTEQRDNLEYPPEEKDNP